MEGLRRHQEQHPDTGTGPLRAARTADLVNVHDTIKRLKGEIRELNRKLEAGLAAQIELRDEKRIRQLYEQRGHEIERLLTHNADLIRTVTQLRELVRSLEDDLAVERTALRELTGQPANVTSIRFGECLTKPADRLLRLRYLNANSLRAGHAGTRPARAARTPAFARECPLSLPLTGEQSTASGRGFIPTSRPLC